MASAIPRRTERTRAAARAAATGWAAPQPDGWTTRELACESIPAETETYRADLHLDASRLLVAVVGLGAMVALPGALFVWVASDVLMGLATRVAAMLP